MGDEPIHHTPVQRRPDRPALRCSVGNCENRRNAGQHSRPSHNHPLVQGSLASDSALVQKYPRYLRTHAPRAHALSVLDVQSVIDAGQPGCPASDTPHRDGHRSEHRERRCDVGMPADHLGGPRTVHDHRGVEAVGRAPPIRAPVPGRAGRRRRAGTAHRSSARWSRPERWSGCAPIRTDRDQAMPITSEASARSAIASPAASPSRWRNELSLSSGKSYTNACRSCSPMA